MSIVVPKTAHNVFRARFRGDRKIRDFTSAEDLCRIIVKRYKNGAAYSSLAREFGIRHRVVKDILEANDIVVTRRGRNREGGRSGWEESFSQPTPNAMYWAGFLMADASMKTKNYVTDLRIHPRDWKHIEKFHRFVGSPWKPRDLQYAGGQRLRQIQLFSEKIFNDLARWGIKPRKGRTDDTAPLGEAIDSDDFWRGVIDGDGSIVMSGTSPVVSLVGRRGIIEAYADFVKRRLGVRPQVRQREGEGGACRTWLSGDNARKLLRLLYGACSPEVRLDRKYEKALSAIKRAVAGDTQSHALDAPG